MRDKVIKDIDDINDFIKNNTDSPPISGGPAMIHEELAKKTENLKKTIADAANIMAEDLSNIKR